MRNKNKIHTVGTLPKSNRKIVERRKIDNLNTQIHDRSLSRLGTYTLRKSAVVKVVLWAQVPLLVK